jgi:hypothetical protein
MPGGGTKTIEWMTSWWNLIFILPFGLGLMYLGLYTVSGWTFGDADGASGLEHDLHVDVDADADADHGTDSGSNGNSRDISHVPFVLSNLTWIPPQSQEVLVKLATAVASQLSPKAAAAVAEHVTSNGDGDVKPSRS